MTTFCIAFYEPYLSTGFTRVYVNNLWFNEPHISGVLYWLNLNSGTPWLTGGARKKKILWECPSYISVYFPNPKTAEVRCLHLSNTGKVRGTDHSTVCGGDVGFIHCKKRLFIFPSPAGMSLNKLSLAGNNLITVFLAKKSLVSDIPAGDWKIDNIFTVYCISRGHRSRAHQPTN
jgi:hypothetical protein